MADLISGRIFGGLCHYHYGRSTRQPDCTQTCGYCGNHDARCYKRPNRETHIPPFIVTMGMMSAARSASWLIIGGQDIVFYYFKDLIQPLFANVPGGPNILPILFLGLAFIGALLLLHKSTFGRYLYAIGGNEKAAVVAGIPVAKTKILVYTLSAFMCSIAAIVYLYRVCSASPAMGEEFLLESIAAIAIGGEYPGRPGQHGGVLIGILY